MTDREPLRVGPLVLSALRTGGTFESCELLAGMALIRAGLAVEVPHDHCGKPIGSVSPFGTLKLTPAGQTVAAAYRSRRRLLARECERRAEHWKSLHRHSEQRVCEAETWADRQEWRRFAASDRARAAKYARWAEKLRQC